MKRFSSVFLATWAWLARGISLALLPALASETAARERVGTATVSLGRHAPLGWPRFNSNRPYLAVVLPPPLRFEAPPPPVDSHIPSAAPPNPGGPIEETATVNRDSVAPTADPASPAPVVTTPPPLAAPPPAPLSLPPAVSVLPDDTPREVQAQDVLPYFQFPGSPPPLPPPSSATYRRR
jgi:hypothetical protein